MFDFRSKYTGVASVNTGDFGVRLAGQIMHSYMKEPVLFADNASSYIEMLFYFQKEFSGKYGAPDRNEILKQVQAIDCSERQNGKNEAGVFFQGKSAFFQVEPSSVQVMDEAYSTYGMYTESIQNDPLFRATTFLGHLLTKKRKNDSKRIQAQILSDITMLVHSTLLFDEDQKYRMYEFGEKLAHLRQIQFMVTGDVRYYTSPKIDEFLKLCEEAQENSDMTMSEVAQGFYSLLKKKGDWFSEYSWVKCNDIKENRRKLIDGEFISDGAYFVDRFTHACEILLPETKEIQEIEMEYDGNNEKPGLWGIRRFHIIKALGGFSSKGQDNNVHTVASAIKKFAANYTKELTKHGSVTTVAPIEGISVKISGLKDHLTSDFRYAAGSDFEYNDMMRRFRDGQGTRSEAKRFIASQARKMAEKALTI